ncbi:hypothetical protein H2200_010116 [Cladophialophora chaetospira]|uniref:DUF3533 domain-containing protein n=1 Tax=Cladophialophora chaetospira TaxID=386627 RepID=A0AA38X275_9EURO|nr:hypothetical protein H2200_010116 [Cladophialophora chaetospira]
MSTSEGYEKLQKETSRRPHNFQQFWRGEWKDESRVPIWHQELRTTRRIVAKEWARTTLLLCGAILALLSIFWGAFLHVRNNLGSLVVWVVDFDGQVAPYDNGTPFVGPMVTKMAESLIETETPHVGFGVLPAEYFDYDPIRVRSLIYQQKAWAAVMVMPNATALLRAAVSTGNSSYDPKEACQIVYVEARDTTAIDTYIMPELYAFQTAVISAVGTAWSKSVLQENLTTTQLSNIQKAPQAIAPAIGFTSVNLRPFGPPQVTPAVSTGLIYLIIVAFFSFSFFMPTHGHFVDQLEGHRRIYFGHLFIWKYFSTLGAYFFMSLSYSLVSLFMLVPFSRGPASPIEPATNPSAYGHASFVVYWMVNFLGMCALGFACENVAMLLGNPWTALWLIFWVITNVCTAFYPIELAPAFYYYGYAWPLHNVVEASRRILFDTHSRIGLNIGVLVTWWAVNTAFFPVCAWWFRQTTLKKRHKRDLFHRAKGEKKSHVTD